MLRRFFLAVLIFNFFYVNIFSQELVFCFAEDGHFSIEFINHTHDCEDDESTSFEDNHIQIAHNHCNDISILGTVDTVGYKIENLVTVDFIENSERIFQEQRYNCALKQLSLHSFSTVPPDKNLFLIHHKTVVIIS